MLAVLILGIGNTRACNITLFSFYSSFSKSWGEKNTFDSFLLFTAEVLSRSGTPHLKHTHTTKVKVFDCRNDWEKVKVFVAMTGKMWKCLIVAMTGKRWKCLIVAMTGKRWKCLIVAMTGKRWKCLIVAMTGKHLWHLVGGGQGY